MTAKVYQAGLIDAAGDVASGARLELVAAVNPVLNGGLEVWQRGATFTSIASGTYGPDRWIYLASGAVVHDLLRSTDVPTIAALVPGTNYSLHLDVTTADAAIAAGDFCIIREAIEGYNWQPFSQKQLTVGFWVKDTITGVHCVALRNSGGDRSCVMEYTVNVADTWEYKTVTFPASPSAGTWDYTTGVGASLSFALSCGSTFQTTAGSWQVGNFLGTSNQVNATSSTANNFKLWGVNMGLGTTVAPYWPRQFEQELALCKRYYQTSYAYGTTVPTTTGATFYTIGTDVVADGSYFYTVRLAPDMRAAPTVTIYPYTTVANTSRVSSFTGTDLAANSGTAGGIAHNSFSVGNTSGGSITTGQTRVYFGWQAVAEL